MISWSSHEPFCNEPVISQMDGGEELEGAEANTEELMTDSHAVTKSETNPKEVNEFKKVLTELKPIKMAQKWARKLEHTKIFKDCDKDGQFRVNQAKKESAGDLK